MEQTLFDYVKEQSYIKNKSLKEIAKDLEVSYPTIINIKHRAPSRMTYHKFANYFNIEVYDLLKFPIKK